MCPFNLLNFWFISVMVFVSVLPGFTVVAIALISLKLIPDNLTASSTTFSMCFLCKS